MKEELIFNKSYGDFVLGEDIHKYLNDKRLYDFRPASNEYERDMYFFTQGIVLVVENEKIDSIIFDEICYWQGKNLIGMHYEDFFKMIKISPDSEDSCYLPTGHNRGQNRKIYYFDSLGLDIWVWRGKIRSVTIDDATLFE